MSKFANQRSKKIGMAPGTLIHIGEKVREKTEVTVFEYDEKFLEEREINSDNEYERLKESSAVKWVNVDGLHQVEVLEKIGESFELHPLVLEDILTTDQRPKVEDYGDYIYVVLKMLHYDNKKERVISEQISLVLGNRFAISFQEKGGDVLEPVRERLRKGIGRIRKMGSDYLVYSLLDAIVDNYFGVLENLSDKIEFAEDELLARPVPKTLQFIQQLRREMLFVHKSVWPLREVIGTLERGESILIEESTRVYFKDVYDHVIQAMDTTETLRDILSGMLDIYLSSVSNKMNEVMKVLTIISTIFIPLTFIAGVYGMNFRNMPELEWQWGYLLVWSIMFIIGLMMVIYFKKKKWL